MAKHITRWTPDTCDCAIDLEWDDADPADQRQHVAVRSKGCRAHAGVGGHAERAAIVTEENQRKNRAIAAILEYRADLGAGDVTAAYGPDRELRLSTRVPLSAAEKTRIRSAFTARGLTKLALD
jgi:hypothetical protein